MKQYLNGYDYTIYLYRENGKVFHKYRYTTNSYDTVTNNI